MSCLVAAMLGAGCGSTLRSAAPTCRPCTSYFQDDTRACALDVAADPQPPRYRNLVLEGGGVKGAAYAGALAALDAHGQLASIERVAGTSAGAITALMVALGYTPAEIHDVVLQVDLGDFRDGSFPGDLKRLVDDYGWYKGDDAQCVLACLVERKTGSKTTTFAQLHRMRQGGKAGMRDLLIFGTDVDAPNPQTLGLHLGTNPPRERVDGLLQFTEELFMTLLDSQVTDLCRTAEDVRRSVFIDPLGIRTTDFDLSQRQKCALMTSGVEATQAYLGRETPQDTCPQWMRSSTPPASRQSP